MLDNLPDGAFLIKSGQIISSNKIFRSLFNSTSEELHNLNIDHLPLELEGNETNSLSQFLSENFQTDVTIKDSAKQEVLCFRKSTEAERILNIRFSHYFHEEEKLILGLCQDITDLYLENRRLRAINEKLQKSGVFANIGSWEWDIKTNRLFWSDAIYSLIGYEAGDIDPSFETFVELTHPDDREAVANAINQCLEDGNPYEVDHRFKRHNGEIIWIKETGNVVRDEKGNPSVMLGIAQDITKMKIAEKARRESEEQFGALFHSSAIGMALLDPQGHPLYTNPHLQHMLGYSGDELATMVFTEFTHPEDADKDMDLYLELVNNRRDHYQMEKRYIHKQGNLLWGMLTVSIVRDEQLQPKYIVGMVQDITDHKKMENERIQLQRQVHQAQKMESIGMLTGGIAHDFNNILGSMLGHTELLSMIADRHSEKANSYIRQILDSGRRAADLVQQLLAYSRGSSGDIKEIDPNGILLSLHKMLKATIPANIKLQTHFPSTRQTVFSDPVQLHQAVMNLVINARDAMTNSSGVIEIGIKDSLIDSVCSSCSNVVCGEYTEIYVQDTGTGIKQEDIKHIFEPFYSTKAIGKGSGMGLSVVHGIMHGCDGHIVVDSNTGGGTAFRLLFPREHGLLPSEIRDSEFKETKSEKGNIIIVDDEIPIVHFLTDLLTMQGYKTHSFTDPTMAYKAFETSPDKFDAIISDHSMPQMTGVELTEKIRNINVNIPVILVTGYSNGVDENNAESLGISHFLNKPIDTGKLLITLENNIIELPSKQNIVLS